MWLELYIDCKILQTQIVSDIAAPLLKIVNTERKYHAFIEKIYDSPHYVRVLVKDITTLEINIKNDLNTDIQFVVGKTKIKLHLRNIRQSYF